MRRGRAALLALLVAGTAAALEFERVEHEGARYTVTRVDPAADRLRLFPAPPAGQSFEDVVRAVAPLRLAFAMNAGMYQEDRSVSVGLLVVDRRSLRPLNRRAANPDLNFYMLPNGVFALTESGPRVVSTGDYPAIAGRTLLATQSGPMLVSGGAIHPRFAPDSRSRHRRNGVGVDARGHALFAISEQAVSFHQFARLFRDRLACADALFLDGGVSSLHAPALGRSDRRADLGPILGVVAAAP